MPRRKNIDSAGTSEESQSIKRGKFDTPGLRWEWENDGSQWTKYSPEHNEVLCGSWPTAKQVELDVGAQGVIVNFAKLIQKNPKNGWTRRVRCCVLDNDTSEFYAWSWRDAKDKAVYYSAENCEKLEDAKRSGRGNVAIDIGGRSYIVDLETMEQTTNSSKSTFTVERERSDAVDRVDVDSANPRIKSSAATNESTTKGTKVKGRVKQEIEAKLSEKSGVEAKSSASTKSSGAAKSSASAKSIKENGVKGKSGIARVVVVAGKAPVDAECTALFDRVHVFCEGKDIWDCMLNQTNVGNNNNKYYIIQLLEENSRPSYHVWQRWGRVGYKGQNNLVPCGPDLDKAKSVFTKKYLDKTKNHWGDRAHFVKVPGKYDLIEMDYSAKEKDEVDSVIKQESITYPECSLDSRLQALLTLICDIKYMEQAMIEMEYDASKAPLGKLTQGQIKGGYEALRTIADLINKGEQGRKLSEACSLFYTRIPHNFGMRPPAPIRTDEEVRVKLQLLEALDDIEVAVKILKEGDRTQNPIDRHYKALDCEIQPMDKSNDDFKILEQYLHDTHASTHSQYTMDVIDVFTCHRQPETDDFRDYGNRVLLWHGSRLTNWVGILTKGLRIAPPEAPVTGYMFGKGVYFADMSSKSANYCFATPSKNVGILLLCEVALGKPNELLAADSHAHKLPPDTHSVKGMGRIGPDPSKHITMSDGVLVPCGKGISTGVTNPRGYTLNYNEYIVYNTKQIRMRYLLKVKFNFAK